MEQERFVDNIIKNNLSPEQLEQFNRIYYGREDHCPLQLKDTTKEAAKYDNLHIAGYAFPARHEQTRCQRIVRLGLVQHSVVLPTDRPIKEQREAIFCKVKKVIEIAASEGVNILCLQELWAIPFFLCTKEKGRWSDFAESVEDGPTTTFLSPLAKKLDMVIVSSILEDDNGTWWNTAVVIDHQGEVVGKHRKNHLPSVGSFSETSYYSAGDTGHPVFNTKFGRIAVNICYGRHHALNWLMFGLNGAEIVFNPAATISQFGESFWAIEARNAAIANGYFTCSINRVGTEEFVKEGGDVVTRTYYGSSYVTAPDGCRTPALSRVMDGFMIAEVNLNLCRQVRDQWGFNTTARLEIYAEELKNMTSEPRNF